MEVLRTPDVIVRRCTALRYLRLRRLPVEPFGQDGTETLVAAADRQSPLRGPFHSVRRIALRQTHHTQARAKPHLRPREVGQDGFDQLGGERTGSCGPGDNALAIPFVLRPVSRRLVGRFRRCLILLAQTDMRSNPFAAMEDLNRRGRGAHLDRFARQLVGHAVKTVPHLHVIVGVYFGFGPDRLVIGLGR